MKKNFYISNDGKIVKKNNSITFLPAKSTQFENSIVSSDPNSIYLQKEKSDIPINTIKSLMLISHCDFNKEFLLLLAKQKIPLHIFNYYGKYSGTFIPNDFNYNGTTKINQYLFNIKKSKRTYLAKQFIIGSIKNSLKNLRYYSRKNENLKIVAKYLSKNIKLCENAKSIETLMGIEGHFKKYYYQSFNFIINNEDFKFVKREYYPPKDNINSLISFGNHLLYAEILNQIMQTELDPTVSYLHATGDNQQPLVYDLSEIFKPMIVDRVIFKAINKKVITKSDFENNGEATYLKRESIKKFTALFDEKINTVILNREKNRKMKYSTVILNECYKIIEHVYQKSIYKPFLSEW